MNEVLIKAHDIAPLLPSGRPVETDVGHIQATGHPSYEYSGRVDRAWFFKQHGREPEGKDRYEGLLRCLTCGAWVRIGPGA